METKFFGAWKSEDGAYVIVAIVQTDDIKSLFTELESKSYFNLHVESYTKLTGGISDGTEFPIQNNLYQLAFRGKIKDWDADTIISRVSTIIFD